MASIPFSISPTTLARLNCVKIVFACATTYTLYVFVEKRGPAFLPMLSDTFVPAPGNYISRVVLSGTALAMGVLGAVPYFATRQASLPCGVLFGMSTVAAVCLGLVGAVCESTDVPSCMGDMDVHDVTAVTFFLLYDVYMGVLSVTAPLYHQLSRSRHAFLLILVSMSLATKLRFASLSPLAARLGVGGSPTWVAVLEYCDVAAMTAWLWMYMGPAGKGHAFGVLVPAAPSPQRSATTRTEALLRPADAPTPPDVLARLSVSTLSEVVSGIAVSTIGYCFAVALHQGIIHPHERWPMISDLWVHKPCNMVSRYCVCLGAHLLAVTHVAHYAAVREQRTAHPLTLRVGTVAALAGAAGLCGVGAVNEVEGPVLHSVLAVTFFGGTILWAVLDLATSTGRWGGGTRATAVIALATCLASKLAQLLFFLKHHSWRSDDDLSIGLSWRAKAATQHPHGLAASEWLAAASLIVYFTLANHAGTELRATHLVYYREAALGAKAGNQASRA